MAPNSAHSLTAWGIPVGAGASGACRLSIHAQQQQHQHQQQAKGGSKQKGGSPFEGQSGKDLQTKLRHLPNAAKRDKTNTHGGSTVVARPTVVCKSRLVWNGGERMVEWGKGGEGESAFGQEPRMEQVRHCVRGCLCRTGHVDVHVHLGLAIVVEHGGGGLGQKLREKVEHLPRNGTMSAFSMIRDHHHANNKARHVSTLHKAPSLPRRARVNTPWQTSTSPFHSSMQTASAELATLQLCGLPAQAACKARITYSCCMGGNNPHTLPYLLSI